MARTILDAQLNAINTKIIQLGTLVETALSQVLQSVHDGDQDICKQVIASDSAIDRLHSEAEQLALQSLTLQQPLHGYDLRFLSSVPSIAGDLERVGDNITGIAALLLRLWPFWAAGTHQLHTDPAAATDTGRKEHLDQQSAQTVTEDAIITGLLELGQEAHRALRETMQAFTQRDSHAARKIWQEDDVVDVRYHLVRHDIMKMLTGMRAIPALQQDPWSMQRMTYWLWMAHNLERIGDHCGKVCKSMVFILEAEVTLQAEDPLEQDDGDDDDDESLPQTEQ